MLGKLKRDPVEKKYARAMAIQRWLDRALERFEGSARSSTSGVSQRVKIRAR